MPRTKMSTYLAVLSLSGLLLAGCGSNAAKPAVGAGQENADSGLSEPSSDGAGEFAHISIFDGEGETPSELERVPLKTAGYVREEITAYEGMLFSYDNGSVFVADYGTGQVPAGFPAENDGANNLAGGTASVTLHTLPVADGGYLYFSDAAIEGERSDGVEELARFDLATGLPEVLATTTEPPQITVHDGVLYYLADGLLTALDTATGEQLWQEGCPVESEIDVVFAVTEHMVGVMDTEAVYGFDVATGERVLDRDTDTWFVGLAAGPQGLYLAEHNAETSASHSVSADLYRINDKSGEEEKFATTRETDVPDLGIVQLAVHEGTVLLKSDYEVHAIDEASGETRWITTVRDETFSEEVEFDLPPMNLYFALDGGTAYIYATGGESKEDNRSRLLAVDTESGDILATHDLGADFDSAGPRIDGDNLVFLANNHTDPEFEALILPKVR